MLTQQLRIPFNASQDRHRPSSYPDEDRQLLRIAVLFIVFHRFYEELDAHIVKQLSNVDPIPVEFGVRALQLLTNFEFSPIECERYFGLFFQLRRAFYLISSNLPGSSPCMTKLKSRIWRNIFTNAPILYEKYLWDKLEDFSTLILGATGTGKGTVAAAIGLSSFIPYDARKMRFTENFTQNFLAVNLAQFPESLIESELFGHVKGAFTGAITANEGFLAKCRPHCVVFIDEVGEISLPTQVKLLKVLQERVYCAVGSFESKKFSGRVIAATNRDLGSLRRQGLFRDDFYYRLCSDVIEVPTLQQRLRENPAELHEILNKVLQNIVGSATPEIVEQMLASIHSSLGENYPWPGNVRELEQCARRIILTGKYEGDVITKWQESGTWIEQARAGKITVETLAGEYCFHVYQQLGTLVATSKVTGLDRRTVKQHISRYLGSVHGSDAE